MKRLIILAFLLVALIVPASAWRHGSTGGSSGACPFGVSGADGCGVSPGLYYLVGSTITTVQPTAAAFAAAAIQSGQAWTANHPETWNIACLDYACGPSITIASMTPISSWGSGSAGVNGTCGVSGTLCGCAYVPIGSTLTGLPNSSYSGVWPHDSSNNALLNALICTGNSNVAYTIQGWNMVDANNGFAVGILFADNTTTQANAPTVINNRWLRTARSMDSCKYGGSGAGSNQTISQPAPGYFICAPVQGNNVGFITIENGTLAPPIIMNNIFDPNFGPNCGYGAYPNLQCGYGAQTSTNAAATVAQLDTPLIMNDVTGSMAGNFTFEFNIAPNAFADLLGLSFTSGSEGTCTNGQSVPNLGAGYPFPGYNLIVKYNGVGGVGEYVGYGHGEIGSLGGSASTGNTYHDLTGGASLSGTTLTFSVNTVKLGSQVFDSTGVIKGGVEVISAPSGAGPYTYTVTNPGSYTVAAGPNFKAFFSSICQYVQDYNTVVLPSTSTAGGMTTTFYGLNTDSAYGTDGSNGSGIVIEYSSIGHNTLASNLVGGATVSGAGPHQNFTFQIGAKATASWALSATTIAVNNCFTSPTGGTIYDVTSALGSGVQTPIGTIASCAGTSPGTITLASPYALVASTGSTDTLSISDPNCQSPYSGGVCAVILGKGSLTSGGTCPGDGGFVGPYQGTYILTGGNAIGINGYQYCNAYDQQVSWVGCGSQVANLCGITWDLIPSTFAAITGPSSPYAYGAANGGSPNSNIEWVNGVASVVGSENGHGTLNFVSNVDNYIDPTGTQGSYVFSVQGSLVFCQKSAVYSGNINLIDGTSLDSSTNPTHSTGC